MFAFHGIDPQGLENLANTLDARTDSVRHQSRVTLDLLHRHDRGAVAAAFSSAVVRIEGWGLDTSCTLRWRAQTIRSGQAAGQDVSRLARAHFAAEAVFAIDTAEETYRQWFADLEESRRRVAEAATNISGWLDQDWTDWDVTNGDLHNIWRTLQGLSNEELDLVIAALSPRQLERWIEEMGNAINGLSRDEKRQVFSSLAANSSGESLGKIHDAILAGGGREEATDLGIAIRHHAADQTIVAFVNYTIDQDLAGQVYSALAPALAAGGIEDGTLVDGMLRGVVSAEQALQLIVVDSLVVGEAAGSNPLDSFIGAVTRSNDPRLQATVFAAMAAMATSADDQLRGLLQQRHHIYDSATTDLLGRPHAGTTAGEVLRAAEPELLVDATAILVSSGNGVVEQLATRFDPDGSLTTAYLYTLVDHDQIGQLGQVVQSLRGGDLVDPTAFSAAGVDPDYQYPHAQNLGFVAGNLRTALERYADAAKSDIDWITRGAHLATAAIGLLYSKALESMSVAALAIEGGAEWITTDNWAAQAKEEIQEQLAQLIETVESSLQPESGATAPNLGEGLQAWDDRYDRIRGR